RATSDIIEPGQNTAPYGSKAMRNAASTSPTTPSRTNPRKGNRGPLLSDVYPRTDIIRNYVNVWWEQCFFDAKGEADFIADHLGPVMERDGFQSIGLLFHDYNKGGMNDWADVVLAHPNATKYISGIALHWYDGYHFNNVQAFHNQYGADYYQLATEGCNCDGVLDWQYDTEWKRAMRYVG
ncbi:hypothetical protein FOZ63_017111, partial [Perkinsus olseni]